MIALDLDGTLLGPDKRISEYSASVLREYKERGVLVVFATARAYRNCLYRGFIDLIGPYGGVFNDGAQVVVGQKEIFSDKISAEAVGGTLEILAAHGICRRIIVDGPKGYFCNDVGGLVGEYGYLPRFHTDSLVAEPSSAFEIAVELSGTIEQARALADEIAAAFDCIDLPHVDRDLLLITKTKVNKMSGLLHLAKHANVDLGGIIAFGDASNDIEMLRGLEHSVAMGNASREVKAIAKYVCGSNDEDGVAKYLLSFLSS